MLSALLGKIGDQSFFFFYTQSYNARVTGTWETLIPFTDIDYLHRH